ncbi:Holliday junction branch migration protein RuvA [Idiomarina tyrosinivorans]|uniref:Holliday junction branch migration complex subunit RuvA n=1 Tax=Idiomarina tyrosinivorans TaxID=1445662 RepID=A0A432ZPD1_9GAMM|nr:Holliday junction branch migration protein RuvA [Idiomarina tyrosinivorans]RUO79775.1 Holliday junction branch migration protein RuvA [Idiomarina tyrosinivorans]
MIGRIRGKLLAKQPPEVVIDVQGVGYEVQVPMSCFYQLPELGEDVTLVTHFVVREDAQLLFGFTSLHERTLFRQLIKAQGVGPKLALTILSGMSAQQFVQAVNAGDVSLLVKLPGVGKKTAERLVVELRDRLSALGSDSPFTDAAPVQNQGDSNTLVSDAKADAVSALVALGYKAAQAEKAVQKVHQQGATSEALIRDALKSFS